jgi:glycosyltransferase involved in cell wall biosynthesis
MWAWIWKKIETAAWADQPNIISISPYVRERVSRFSRARIFDIDNPINSSFFQIEGNSANKIIFSAAVICPRKNTLALIRAFSRVLSRGCDAELRLAGSIIDPAYGKAVEEYIQRRGLEKNVFLLGRLSSEEVKDELARAAVFALVSLEENSPMGIEEAMAASLPVVTSNRCGMPYMVRDCTSGYLVDPFAVDQIADRLHRLLNDLDLNRKMGRKGREIALDRFHPDVVARRTREVYFEICR